MPAKQITWSEEERGKIVDEFIRLYGLTTDPTDSKIRAVAKTALPPERFRKYISPQDPVKYRICQTQNREFIPPKSSRELVSRISRKTKKQPRVPQPTNNDHRISEQEILDAARGVVATLQQNQTNIALLRKMLGIIHVATQVAIDSLGH